MITLGLGLGIPFGGGGGGGGGGPTAPVNTVLPALSTTTPAYGVSLSTTNGTWTQTPTGYTYQWTRAGTNISGATSSSYTPVQADVGQALACVVTATNATGSTPATSNSSSGVTQVPANTAAPALSTTSPVVGTSMSVTNGTWNGYPVPTYTYQWEWADTSANISGATSSSYTPVTGDAGHTLLCKVTGTNSVGNSTTNSNTSSAVPGSFTGVLDGLAQYPSCAHSIRRLTSTYTGPLINVRRSSDNTTMDIGYLTNGNLDTATLLTFVGTTGSSNGYINKWYDQFTAHSDMSADSNADQPSIVLAGSVVVVNTIPTVNFSGSTVGLLATNYCGSNSGTTAFTGNVVAYSANSAIAVSTIYGLESFGDSNDNTTNNSIRFVGTAGSAHTIEWARDSTAGTTGTTDGAMHQYSLQVNGTSYGMYIDNTGPYGTTGPSAGLGGGVQAVRPCMGANFGNSNSGIAVSEAMYFKNALSSGDLSTLQANQVTYFGT